MPIETATSPQEEATDWAKTLLQRQFCILDTETTGLGPEAQILQIAVIDRDGTPLLDTLIRPTTPIQDGAKAIHGIGYDQVKNAPTADQLLVPMLQAIGSRDVVIYNAEFDLKLLKQSLRAHGVQLAFPTSDRRKCRVFTNGGSIHCAMLWYSQWVGDWNGYYNNYKWQKLPGGDHSAIGDCRATLDVIQEMAS